MILVNLPANLLANWASGQSLPSFAAASTAALAVSFRHALSALSPRTNLIRAFSHTNLETQRKISTLVGMARKFKDLSEREILALAVSLEEEDGTILAD